MRLARAIFILALAVGIATLCVEMVNHGLGLSIATLAATLVLAAGIGFFEGVEHVMREFRSGGEATCVGGPLDGIKLPTPPFDLDANFVLLTPEHPEGAYRLEGDRLVWEEGPVE